MKWTRQDIPKESERFLIMKVERKGIDFRNPKKKKKKQNYFKSLFSGSRVSFFKESSFHVAFIFYFLKSWGNI